MGSSVIALMSQAVHVVQLEHITGPANVISARSSLHQSAHFQCLCVKHKCISWSYLGCICPQELAALGTLIDIAGQHPIQFGPATGRRWYLVASISPQASAVCSLGHGIVADSIYGTEIRANITYAQFIGVNRLLA